MFPDLLNAVENKMKQLDQKFKTRKDFEKRNNNISEADVQAANEDVMAFLDDMD